MTVNPEPAPCLTPSEPAGADLQAQKAPGGGFFVPSDGMRDLARYLLETKALIAAQADCISARSSK